LKLLKININKPESETREHSKNTDERKT
jgi:hypothetical protein